MVPVQLRRSLHEMDKQHGRCLDLMIFGPYVMCPV